MKTSPEALAVACFTTLSAIMLGGWSGIGMLVARLGGNVMPVGGPVVLGLIHAAAVAVPGVVLGLAARSAAEATTVPWARTVGQAAVLLSGIVVLLSVLFGLTAAMNMGYPMMPAF